MIPRKITGTLLALAVFLGGCSSQATPTPPTLDEGSQPSSGSELNPSASANTAAAEPGPATAPATPFPEYPLALGPDLKDFPAHYNPLSGQPVRDVSALDLPAMLISISNFPATARPQAGLSFASYVFEFSITEGATRFLSVFYGDFPRLEIPFMGECEIRMQPFVQTTHQILGNRVWLDANENGLQDFDEPGVGGVCVNLLDASGNLVEQTTTDSNGYYGFNNPPADKIAGDTLIIEVLPPRDLHFTASKAGRDELDSDVDPATGRMQAERSSTQMDLDAGLVPAAGTTPTLDPGRAGVTAQVGPVRSGRMIYADLANMFQDSCLVYAFASAEVLAQIPTCSMVTHDVSGGGYMLDLTRMRAIAEDNEKADTQFDYSGNRFTVSPPEGGIPGTQLNAYFAYLNQSGWKYDPLMQSYLRYTDTSEMERAGELYPDTDRLTGRQLHFENVILLFTDHLVISPTNLDIDLEQGGEGPAYLFRDGQAYSIRWSTKAGEYEKKSGLRRPIHWTNLDGSLFPLKPGHTWVIVVTPFSTTENDGSGLWSLRFYPPDGSK